MIEDRDATIDHGKADLVEHFPQAPRAGGRSLCMENLEETRLILGTKSMNIRWNTAPDEIADLFASHLGLEREQKMTQAEALRIVMSDTNTPQGSTFVQNNSPVIQANPERITEYSIERFIERCLFLRPMASATGRPTVQIDTMTTDETQPRMI
jgi:hypothetical protein